MRSIAKLQRRIYAANMALRYFIRTHWVFKNAKFLELNKDIKPEDMDDFRFDKFVTGDIRQYFIASMYGKCNCFCSIRDIYFAHLNIFFIILFFSF